MTNIKILSLSIVDPMDQTVQEYQTATFTVSVSGAADPVTYMWERSLDNGITWELTSRTGSSISMVGLLEKNIPFPRQFRATAIDNVGDLITSAPATLTVIPEVKPTDGTCAPGPQKSRHVYTLNFGDCTGEFRLYFDLNPCNDLVQRTPSRVQITWDDQSADTGFRGNSFFNQQLADLGFPNATSASQKGYIVINKDSATPTTGKIIIDTPFQGSGVEVVLECPEVCGMDSDSDMGSDMGSDSDSAAPRNLCFAPIPCPIIAATDYLETPGPGDERNISVNNEEFVTKIQIPTWVAGLGGSENDFTNVIIKGLPIDIENIGVADTIVKRLDTVSGMAIADKQNYSLDIPEIDAEPDPNNITRLEIVGLSLKSVEPIEADGGAMYDMYVGLRSYIDADNEDFVSKGAMSIAYEKTPEPGSGRPGNYLSGIWSSRFMMKVACVLVPAGSLADFEPTKNENGTWNPPLKKPLDPETGLADPKGLVHRLVKMSADSGYDQNAPSPQSVRILEAGVEPLPGGEPPSIAVDKLFDCQNSGFVKDPEAPQIEPDNPGAIAFAPDKLGNSEPAATGNIGVVSEVTSPHDAGCKDGAETCTDRVTHGVAGQPNRTLCEGPDCGGATPASVGEV